MLKRLSTALMCLVLFAGATGRCAEIHYVGSASTLQAATNVIVEGNYAYVSQWKQDAGGTIIDGYGEFQIFDITSPAAPVAIGHLALTDAGRGICKSGDLVYIATAYEGVTIINVANPAAPSLVHLLNTPHIAIDVWVEGTTLWVADAATGIIAYDVATPTSPVTLSTFDTPYQAYSLCKSGGYLYATDLERFYILDVTNPAAPVQKSAINYGGSYVDWFHDVTVDGNHAYIASGFNGIKVVDVSNPSAATVVATLDTDGETFRVKKSGNRLFVADAAGGVDLIDVTVPTAPVQAATYSALTHAYGLDIAGAYVYVADLIGGLHILTDVEIPEVSVAPASLDFGSVYLDAPTSGRTVTISNIGDGDLSFLGAGLEIVGSSEFFISNNPDTTSTLASGASLPVVVSFDPEGSTGPRSATLKVYTDDPDTTTVEVSLAGEAIQWIPLAPAGSASTLMTATNVVVEGNYAYVSEWYQNASGTIIDGYGEFEIFDVSNPTAPVQVGHLALTDAGRGICKSGDLVYIATAWKGVTIINVSNPASPSLVYVLNTPHIALDVLVAGTTLWVADAATGVIAYNVGTPTAPVTLSTFDTPNQADGLCKAGNYLYVTDLTRFYILDVTNPASPVQKSTINYAGTYEDWFRHVVVDGNYAFIASSFTGIKVVDISNPLAASVVATLDNNGQAFRLAKRGNYLYVADTNGGLDMIDVSVPAAPVQVDTYDTPGQAYGLDVVEPFIYVADMTAGLQILTHEATPWVSVAPTSLDLGAVHVNDGPTSGRTVLVTNIGNMDLHFQGAGLEVVGGSEFFIANTPDTQSPIAPGVSVPVTVSFDPAGAAGARSATLNIYTDDPRTTTVQVALTGTATDEIPISLVGNAATLRTATNVVVDGIHAYVSQWRQDAGGTIIDGYGEFQVFDVSDPAAPVAVGHLALSDAGRGLCKSGNLVYIATAYEGVTIVDVSDPAAPSLVHVLNTPHIAIDVLVEGTTLWVADAATGVVAYNVSTPTAPVVLSTFDTPHQAYGLCKSGNFLYVSDLNRFYVLDVTNPASPVQKSTIDYAGTYEDWFRHLVVDGNYAYLASSFTGIKVIDIGNPLAATVVATLDTNGQTFRVDKRGDYLFVADTSGGVDMIDVSVPTAPVQVGTYSALTAAYGLDVDGPYIYVADLLAGLQILSFGESPRVYVTPTSVDMGSVLLDDGPSTRTVTIRNTGNADLGFVGIGLEIAGSGEFSIVNGPSPSSTLAAGASVPVTVGFDPEGAAGSRSATLNIYTNDPDTTTVQVSLTGTALEPPSDVTTLGSAATLQTAIKVIVDGSYAFVSQWKQDSGGTIVDGTGELQIFDVSNPAAPVSVGHLTISDAGRGICKSGSLVYIATAWKGFTIVDVSNPAAPALVKVQDTSGIALDVWIDGTTLWVADAMGGVKAYNVGTPTAPALLSTYSTVNQANGLCKTGNLMCVTDLNRFYVLDVTNPASPVLKDTIDYNGSYTDWFRHVTVDGHYAYTANYATGIKVIDISDPANIGVVATYDTAGAAWHVAKKGDCLYVADGANGVDVIDVSTPSSPVHAATHDTPGSAMGLDVSEPCLYVADMTAGLRILYTIYPVTVSHVNFPYLGVEYGSIQYPFNTLEEGIARVIAGGTVRVTGQTSAPIRITKPMRLESYNGSARIGGIN